MAVRGSNVFQLTQNPFFSLLCEDINKKNIIDLIVYAGCLEIRNFAANFEGGK